MAWLANGARRAIRAAWRPRAAGLTIGIAGLLLGAAAALAQTPAPPDAPTSLLPEAIDEQPAPAGAPPANLLPDAPPAPPFAPQRFERPPPSAQAPAPLPAPVEIPPPDPLADLVGPVTLPEDAGLLHAGNGGLSTTLFAGSDARFAGTLLRRLDGPVASRWAQILLTRALLTRGAAPAGLNPGDWLAARGEALVAIGSASDAHRMILRVLPDRYTPGLYRVAASAAIAAGDPIALCPLSATARSLFDDGFWTMADAMCLSIAGDDYGASQLFDRLRRRNTVSDFDIGLAERLSSAVGGGRRGANPEWGEVDGLSAWRIGLSSAAGLDVPDALVAAAGPAQQAWLVRLPAQSLARRAALAPGAAAIGAISAAESNRLFAAEAASLDPATMAQSPGGQLRAATLSSETAARREALAAFMARGDAAGRYGWLVAAAPAAARIPISADAGPLAADVAAAMVAAGMTDAAARWWRVADALPEDTRAALWATLAPVSSDVPVSDNLFDRWAGTVPAERAARLAAGLRGLGRGTLGREIAPIDNDWTRALDRAVAERRAGDVILLVATGMQAGWSAVPPDYLRRMAAALSAVGHGAEARLIVAEAAIRE